MDTTDITNHLELELAALATRLKPQGVPLIIGGGYGLLLRQKFVDAARQRTLFPIPAGRATNDLDIFLSVEVVADSSMMEALRDALYSRGYEPIPGAEHYQFARKIKLRGRERTLKVDLLAPPPRDPEVRKTMKIDKRRVRPRGSTKIHAHTTEEAFSVSDKLLSLTVGGLRPVAVSVPHPFSFLLLKLFAYRDRQNDEKKEYGQYHAFDLYRILAMTSEREFEECEELRDHYFDDEVFGEARRIGADYFFSEDSKGVLAMLEHAKRAGLDLSLLQTKGFCSAMVVVLSPT